MAVNIGETAAPKPVEDPAQNHNNRVFYNKLSEHIGQVVTKATGVAANNEFSVSHSLGRIPTQVELLVAEAQGSNYIQIRPSGTAWTKTLVYLHCNTNTVTLKLRIS